MTRSFLNMITVDGRLCRLAEFGFFADLPSFDGDCIIFRQGDKHRRFDLDTGMVTTADAQKTEKKHTSPDENYSVRLEFASELTEGRVYVHLILRNNEKSTETVLTRFMGCSESIGDNPFSADSERIVFFGYPENELG